LGDNAKMVAVGQHPFFLDDLVRAAEPAAPLRLPCREVARFGQPVVFAHALQHAIELRALVQPFGI
jgi:hypothetical protein